MKMKYKDFKLHKQSMESYKKSLQEIKDSYGLQLSEFAEEIVQTTIIWVCQKGKLNFVSTGIYFYFETETGEVIDSCSVVNNKKHKYLSDVFEVLNMNIDSFFKVGNIVRSIKYEDWKDEP
jgi:hypothetical protein